MNEVTKLMRRHSSVRSYTNETIEKELLEEIIASGQCASTSSFIQAYGVVRVVSPKKRAIIAEVAGGQPWIISAPEFLVMCADMQRINYACHKSGNSELEGFTEHLISSSVDVALMAQNTLLAAESFGLGGVFIGGIRNDPTTLSQLLNLPQHVYPVFGLCLGWPKSKNESKPRFPVSAILHEDTYNYDSVKDQVDQYDTTMSDYYASRSQNAKVSDWSLPTTRAIQNKKRKHMLSFLKSRGFLKQ